MRDDEAIPYCQGLIKTRLLRHAHGVTRNDHSATFYEAIKFKPGKKTGVYFCLL